MPQYLKPEVRDRIAGAALRVFARDGYQGATMAGIARAADVSTGNIYRYYENKEALFYAVVPDAFVERFLSLLQRRVSAAEGVEDIRDLAETHAYPVAAGQMLEFAIQHRLRVVILLDRSRGTRYETVGEDVVAGLVDAAVRHFVAPERTIPQTLRFDLEQIYRNYVGTLVRILEHFEREEEIREATEAYTRYHLVGLKSLFG